jgi:hypothetical protein
VTRFANRCHFFEVVQTELGELNESQKSANSCYASDSFQPSGYKADLLGGFEVDD